MSATVLFGQQYANQCLLIGTIPCDPSSIESLGCITSSKMPEYRVLHGSGDAAAIALGALSGGSYFAAVIPYSLFADGFARLAFRCPNTSKVFLPEVSLDHRQTDDLAWKGVLDFIESECNSLHLIGASIAELIDRLRGGNSTKGEVSSICGRHGQFEEISQGCACGWINVSSPTQAVELLIWGQQRLLGFGNVGGVRPDLTLIGLPGNPRGFRNQLNKLWIEEVHYVGVVSSDEWGRCSSFVIGYSATTTDSMLFLSLFVGPSKYGSDTKAESRSDTDYITAQT